VPPLFDAEEPDDPLELFEPLEPPPHPAMTASASAPASAAMKFLLRYDMVPSSGCEARATLPRPLRAVQDVSILRP
jgi:hypothetical protein